VENVGSFAMSVSEECLLLRELSHRIHNEFASAMAAVTLSAMQSANDEVKAALAAVRDRLYRYAQVHRVLEMPDGEELVDAASHLQVLCAAVSRSTLEQQKIALVLDAAPVTLRAGQSWRLNMIVAELITNAQRHAFNGAPGTIRIALSCSGPIVECCVTDDGCGSRRAKPGRGLGIIAALSESLGGRITQHFGLQGSRSIIVFPAPDAFADEADDVRTPSAQHVARIAT
jgi:two-component sensor histidine kinase